MSCILDKDELIANLSHNITLFENRFPDLYKLLKFDRATPTSLLKIIPKEYEMPLSLKDECYTLKVQDHYIHSKYSPIIEGKRIYSSINMHYVCNSYFCFLGLGLAYHVESCIKENNNAGIVLVEPDIFIFILFLASRKLDFLFSHPSLIIIPATSPTETLAILENIDVNNSFYFKADLDVSKSWFIEFNTLKNRHHRKHLLNCNTLKKFYIRWLKNFIKNISITSTLPSISIFKNAFLGFSSIIFAAGPSLDFHIKELKSLQNQFIIIAVDTSLKALLEGGITPDFVLLMDGQYLNYLHILGVNAPYSILITESSVYPSVFYSNFKAKCLVSSFFPLGKYMEGNTNESLSAGGSVATTAWDFARFIGCNPIIMAGLDLAFTQNKTHSSACKFEKDAMVFSDRFLTLEKTSYKMLDINNTEKAKGYKGYVLTDAKMKMFAWWFESKIEEYPDIKTYNFMAQGLKIPNMPSIEKSEVLSFLTGKDKKEIIDIVLEKDKKDVSFNEKAILFDKISSSFMRLLILVNEAITFLGKKSKNILYQLQVINKKIKEDEIYSHTGFDAILKSIEAEFESIENISQINEAKLKKISEFYILLKRTIEKSINILGNEGV
ncbi:MAG: motility associated factor glycosyltransferase family protein [Treponema sp.]